MIENTELQGILEYLKEARKLQRTYRATPQVDGRYENVAEHSWSTALLCMTLMPYLKEEFEDIDELKVLKIALIHDLGEVYTGDTPVWDITSSEDKYTQEQASMKQLVSSLSPQLQNSILSLWEENEAHTSREAQIVRSLDRLDPVIHRVVNSFGWNNVKGDHGTKEQLDNRQLPRHQFSKTITAFYTFIVNKAQQEDLLN